MTDAIQRAKFAQVLGAVNSRSKVEPVDIPMTSAEFKKEFLDKINPDKTKETEIEIKSALNRLLSKPGWLTGMTKHVMEEIGTDPTPKNKKYVYNVIRTYIDEFVDSAV